MKQYDGSVVLPGGAHYAFPREQAGPAIPHDEGGEMSRPSKEDYYWRTIMADKDQQPKPQVPAEPPVPERPKPLEGDEGDPPDPPPPGVPVGPGKTTP